MNQNLCGSKIMDDFQDGRLRILIADHERAILYRKMLSSSYDLVLCHQGDEAVKAVERSLGEKRPFAVAFLDIQMHIGPDGVELPERIHKLDPSTEVVIITDDSAVSSEKIAYHVSPGDKLLHLQKPFSAFEIQQLASVLGTKWQESRRIGKIHKDLKNQVEKQSAELARLDKELRKQIAKRKRSEAVLRESREIFYSFMKYLPAMSFIKDRKGCYIYLNETCKKVFGANTADRIGKTDDEFLPIQVAQQLKANDRIVMTEGKVLNILETIEIRDEIRYLLVSKFPIFKNGKPFFLGGIATDITDKIHAEKQRRVLRKKIHPLMNTIIDMCEMITDMAAYTEHRESLNTIFASAKSLRVLINEILDIGIEVDEPGFKNIAFPVEDAAESPDPEPQVLPDSLPGLNIREAVKRLGGNWYLYADIFVFFCDDKKNFARDFRAFVENEEFEIALINAHALKGSAATISATRLNKAAKALEDICKSKNKAQILDLLGPVADAIEHVRTFREQIAILLKTDIEIGGPPALPELCELFRKFDKSLQESDPLESENCLREIKLSFAPGRSNDSETEILLQELTQQTSDYNFDGAREILNKLAQKLGIPAF